VTRDPKKDPPLDTPRRVAELTAELEAANRELEAFPIRSPMTCARRCGTSTGLRGWRSKNRTAWMTL